jgi:hypothetical protein
MKPKNLFSFAVALVLLLLAVSNTSAQTSAQERADALRLQLEELKTKQFDLESRLKVLEEQSKPENIENSLAGVGSTHPEDLRELKRKQFETEKAGVQKQLALLAESRSRLEVGIAQAEASAYHESAKGPSVVEQPAPQIEKQRPRRARAKRKVNKKS